MGDSKGNGTTPDARPGDTTDRIARAVAAQHAAPSREPGLKVSYVALGALVAAVVLGVDLWARIATAGNTSGERAAEAKATAGEVKALGATALDHEKRITTQEARFSDLDKKVDGVASDVKELLQRARAR